ncbi:MAG: AMP-binding protein [Verrucomicrobia bacterium]|nr:AMP-binding protein [Verrucomicrobiota bacterium]
MNIFSLIRQQAESQPDQVAYHNFNDPAGPLTYRELVAKAEAFARRLRARGVRPGERHGLYLDEGSDFLVTALGLLAAGVCMVPMGTFLPGTEVDYIVAAAGLHALHTNRKAGGFRKAGAPTIDNHGDQEFRAACPAYIRFTSGTTGRRKGVLLSHQTIFDRLGAADQILRITPRDRVWFQLPMADHFVVSVLLYLSRGATILTASSQTDETWRALAETHAPTLIYGSPAFYRELNASPVAALPEVRLAISTTSLLPQKVQHDFRSRFGRWLNVALGIIEVGLLTLDQMHARPGSVGTMMPAYQVTIVGADGRPVPAGELGELHVAGPGLLDAYLNPWRPRRRLLGEHGFPTGDFARLDSERNLYLAGRGRSRVTVDGLVFFYEEVEAVLDALPGIAESRVYLDKASGKLGAQLVYEAGATGLKRIEPSLFPDLRMAPAFLTAVNSLTRTTNGKLSRAE